MKCNLHYVLVHFALGAVDPQANKNPVGFLSHARFTDLERCRPIRDCGSDNLSQD
jgi:hypothetical protein